MDKEFLTSQEIPEEKHEAILNEFNNSISEIENAVKSSIKVEGIEPEDGESKAQFLGRLVKIDKSDAVNGAYGNFTPIIKSIAGLEKNDKEKETEWLKRSIREKIESVQGDFTTKIAEYEKKLKAGVKDETLLNEITELKKVLDEERTAKDNLKSEYETKFERSNTENILKSALPKIKDGVSNLVKENAIEIVISEIIDKGYKVSKNDKGQLEIDLGQEGKFKTILAKDYFTDKLEGIIEVENGGAPGS
jgi:Skp family chaperone for outer membrane proteins